jgi:hypothetical protein
MKYVYTEETWIPAELSWIEWLNAPGAFERRGRLVGFVQIEPKRDYLIPCIYSIMRKATFEKEVEG